MPVVWQTGTASEAGDRQLQRLRAVAGLHRMPELPDQARVAKRPVAVIDLRCFHIATHIFCMFHLVHSRRSCSLLLRFPFLHEAKHVGMLDAVCVLAMYLP